MLRWNIDFLCGKAGTAGEVLEEVGVVRGVEVEVCVVGVFRL